MSRTTLLTLIAITALALVLRLAWLANTDTETPFLSDPQYYDATAANIADGRGYSVRLDERGFAPGPGGEGTAFWAPGYSAAIAVPYALFGDDIRWAKLLNAVAGALACVPVFFVARYLSTALRATPLHMRGEGWVIRSQGGDGAGLVAAGMVAVMPALVYWTPVLFSDGLFMFGVASTLALAGWASDRGTWWACAICGLALTATVFVRSQGVLLLVPVAMLLWRATPVPEDEGHARRAPTASSVRGVAPLLIVVGVLALAVVPWAVRNQRVMGEPFLVSDNVCYNLRGAHAPYATGTSVAIQDLWDESPGTSFKERELLFDDLGCERAWEYARAHPGRELELAAKRVGWLLRSDAAPAMRWSETLGATPIDRGDRDLLVLIGDAWWYIVLALAAASPFVVARTRMAVALWAFCAAWIAMHLIFHGEPRYHVAMVPALVPLAAAVSVIALGRLRSPTRRSAASR